MKEIPLTKGCVALVDDEDYDRLRVHKWFAHRTRGLVYARREVGGKAARRVISMEREILVAVPESALIDHVQHFPGIADNRKENLRATTPAGNAANNRKTTRPKTSIFKGVSIVRKTGYWQVAIGNRETFKYLGHFREEGLAALAYDLAAVERYGAQALTNFPVPGSHRSIFGVA